MKAAVLSQTAHTLANIPQKQNVELKFQHQNGMISILVKAFLAQIILIAQMLAAVMPAAKMAAQMQKEKNIGKDCQASRRPFARIDLNSSKEHVISKIQPV